MKTLSRIAVVLVGLAVLLAVPVAVHMYLPGVAGAQGGAKIWKDSDSKAADPPKQAVVISSFAELVKKASPAVVNISFERTFSMPWGGKRVNPFGGGPFHDFFERYFGEMPREFKNKGLGSGFIINPEGYVVTNNHVIEKADRVVVKLKDDDREFVAKVIGRDPKTDVALIKIDVGKALPVLPLGDSDKMEVGDWVVAIGNPLGLSHTVTKGIVSFKGRKEIRPGGPGGYYDFIQTDAPINPGNSGGPLLNIQGEVIGVNDAIAGDAQNIGFAIPINMVKTIIPSLREHGKVVRSWLGVQIQPVSEELADSFGMKKAEGALISEVVTDGPAEKAGVKPGDVILEFNGKRIARADDLPWLASNAGVGADATVKVFRDGKEKEFKVRLGELPEGAAKAVGAPGKSEGIGVTVRSVPADVASGLRLKSGKGVLVSNVDDDSRAAAAGLQLGDVILKINDRETNSPGEFTGALGAVKKGAIVRMLVRRGEGNVFLAFKKE
ncbi:MAG: DegQ family serine endoprotease [Deltaproteobacteria bacterium]|nr:DegQ family serine endoprotease [Deltaproteobacteria bacterium]